jgi:hypothetical protein
VLYERHARRVIRGQRLASEALSPEMENVLQRNTNNVKYEAHVCKLEILYKFCKGTGTDTFLYF